MNNTIFGSWQRSIQSSVFALVLTSIPASAGAQSIFTNQTSPSPNPHGNTLNAVAAVSANDVWAVGYKNDNNLNDSRTLVMHWNGASWQTVASPNPASTPDCQNFNTGNVLSAVSATSTDDVWAVGFSFSCSALLVPMIQHWDGTSWKAVRSPKLRTNDNSALTGVVAFAPNNVYAVGYQPASNGAVLTLVEHWDGKSWKVMSSPNANHTGNVLAGISANAPTDIWAVGDQVAPGVPVKTLAEHFDGVKWTLVPTPNVFPTGSSNQNVLTSVQAVSPKDVTAAGFVLDAGSQRLLTLIEHWDGTRWSIINSPNHGSAAGSTNLLRGITAVSATDLYAIGFFADSTSFGEQQTLVEHFDGHSWSVIPTPKKGLAQQLNGGFALPGTQNVWGVGAFSTDGTDPETGLLNVPKTLVIFSPIG